MRIPRGPRFRPWTPMVRGNPGAPACVADSAGKVGDVVIALIDETSPTGPGGIYYVVSAAVVLDQGTLAGPLRSIFGSGRTKPFHWVTEGSAVLDRMVRLICEGGVVTHVTVHYPTGRRRQEEARGLALSELVPLVVAEGVTDLIIESRSEREDGRDRGTLIEITRELVDELDYRWEPKTEPLLWIADAICGSVKQYLLGEDAGPFERLRAAGVIGDLRYRHLP